MRLTWILSCLGAIICSAAAAETETRCGWLDNPTPANWWIVDADGEWTISIQGRGWQSEIFDIDWSGQIDWIETNGSYGYGCACIDGNFDRETRWLTQALRAEWLPLDRCIADPALPPRS